MAKLILHIGMHKTGSTALQQSFAAASGGDFVYPQLGAPPFKLHHTDTLIQLFSSKSGKLTANKEFAGKPIRPAEHDRERIGEIAAEAGDRPVILSSEGAFSFLKPRDVVALKALMEPLFDDIKVVAYVREPFGQISSALQNWIRSNRLSQFTPKYKKYRLFQNFDDVFGRENVHLWKYDRSNFPNGDVVQHFCKELQLKPLASAEVNSSLSRPAASAIYRLNRLVGGGEDEADLEAFLEARRAVINRFLHRDWPKLRLSPKVAAPLIAANADDLEWIEKRMNCSMRDEPREHEDDITSEADLLAIDQAALPALLAVGETLADGARAFLQRALAA